MRIYNASGVMQTGNKGQGNNSNYIHCSGLGQDLFNCTPRLDNCTALSAVLPAGSGLRVNFLVSPPYPIILDEVSVFVTATPVGVPEYWITLGLYRNITRFSEQVSKLRMVCYPGELIAQSFEIPVTTQGKISWKANVRLEPNKLYWLAYLPSRSNLSVRGVTAGGANCFPIYGIANALGTSPTWGYSAGVTAANALVRATGLPESYPLVGVAQGTLQPCIFYRAIYAGGR